jgi:NAD(P)-dependent dehydrogenase (short-subunit alcohol dehydrogenase family)
VSAPAGLAPRVAVVTGGSSGIGAAVARRLAAGGWLCVLLARGRERLERVAGELGAEAEVCDVGDRAQVDAVAERVGGRHEAVHLLVNNAGIPAGGGFLEIPAERIEAVTDVNYLGGVWCLRAFLPLLERGVPSDVVTVASVAGTATPLTSGPYAASKHAQLAFSRSVASELAPRGIRVHSVNPGPVPTDRFPQDRTLAGRFSRHFVVSPDAVAATILGAVARDRREVFVPRVFRVVGAAQALAPGTLSRLATRLRWTR